LNRTLKAEAVLSLAIGASVLLAGTSLALAADGPAAAASIATPTTDVGAALAGSVAIGDFEGKLVRNRKDHHAAVLNAGKELGWGWAATSDQRRGGQSTAHVSLAHPGAQGTHGALQVKGELKRGFMAPWAGAIWFPGERPMQPADLSGHNELTFRAKGKPGSYSIMVMTDASPIPRYQPFDLTAGWKRYRIPLQTGFPGADWQHVAFIAFSAGALGKFHFELDQVALQ
jgi:hypothetical protein